MITINYGKDWTKTTYDTLAASDIGLCLKQGMSVAIKPNLVVPSPPNDGATTHPEVVEGIIQYLKNFGIKTKDIRIMESSAVGYSTSHSYKVCGYTYIEKQYGIPLIDLKSSPTVTRSYHGLDIQIAEDALNTDFLINVPVLKAHCQTRLTCCMKNLKGCIPEKEMRRFHTLGLHKPIAALSALLPVHYCVIDGICGDLSFEEGGSPVEANRILAGRDPVLMDSYCAELIGYRPETIEYLAQAREDGLGKFYSQQTKIVELNTDDKPARQQKSARLSERFRSNNSDYIEEKSACSVCYAALIFALHRSGRSKSKKICIGQGFKGQSRDTDAIGIGSCTNGFDIYVKGCPPKAVDIIEALNSQN